MAPRGSVVYSPTRWFTMSMCALVVGFGAAFVLTGHWFEGVIGLVLGVGAAVRAWPTGIAVADGEVVVRRFGKPVRRPAAGTRASVSHGDQARGGADVVMPRLRFGNGETYDVVEMARFAFLDRDESRTRADVDRINALLKGRPKAIR